MEARPHPHKHGLPELRWIGVGMLAVAAVIAMQLSSAQMYALRVAMPHLSEAMGWLEGLPLPVDMHHVAFFALLVAGARLLLSRMRWPWLLAGALLLAVFTEALQLLTDGRTPRATDVRDDMVGAVLGLLIATPLLHLGSQPAALLAGARTLVACALLLLPLQLWSPFAAFGFPAIAADVAMLAALGLRAIALLGDGAPLRLSGFHAWSLAYLMAMGMGVLVLVPACTAAGICDAWQPGFLAAWGAWVRIGWLVAIAVLVCDLARDEASRRRMVLAWLAGCALACAVALGAVVAFYVGGSTREWAQPLLSHYGSLPPGPYPRIRGLFANANMFGLYLLLSAALALQARAWGWWSGRWLRLFLLLMLVPLLATASPAPAAVAVLLAMWWARSRASAPAGSGVLVALATLALLANAVALAVNPVAPFVEPSVRVQLWSQALATWQGAFWRGSGLGQPPAQLIHAAPDGGRQFLTDAHNIVLNIGAQAGILGVVAFAGLVGYLLWASRGARAPSTLRWGLLLATLYMGLGSSFEDARVLWVYMGLMAAAVPWWHDRTMLPADHMPAMPSPAAPGTGTGLPPDQLDHACARLLLGDRQPLQQALSSHGVAAALHAIQRHGIESLAHARLADSGGATPIDVELASALADRARRHAARYLLWSRETHRIQAALDAAGIPCIWLKGTALGQWLYPRVELRDLDDLDLLLADHASMLKAADALRPLGYRLPNAHIAGDLVVHELLAVNDRLQLELDLHWDVSNDALYAERLDWEGLLLRARQLTRSGGRVLGLCGVDAFLHAAMHRSTNHLTGRQDRLRWLYDLHLLALQFTPAEWDSVLGQAGRLGLAHACDDALAAIQIHFDTPLPPHARAGLARLVAREGIRPARLRNWWYFQWVTLHRLDGVARWRWLRQRLWPDFAHLRERYGSAGAGAVRIGVRRLVDGLGRLRRYTGRIP